jgi:hypothetical protein
MRALRPNASADSRGRADREGSLLPDGHPAIGRPDPALNCKLAEALLHEGRCEDALVWVRRGFPAVGDDPALLRICAWVFRTEL